MLQVAGSEAAQEGIDGVGTVVGIGIADVQQVRRRGHEQPPPEGQHGRSQPQAVGEEVAFVVNPVVVGIAQLDDAALFRAKRVARHLQDVGARPLVELDIYGVEDQGLGGNAGEDEIVGYREFGEPFEGRGATENQ